MSSSLLANNISKKFLCFTLTWKLVYFSFPLPLPLLCRHRSVPSSLSHSHFFLSTSPCSQLTSGLCLMTAKMTIVTPLSSDVNSSAGMGVGRKAMASSVLSLRTSRPPPNPPNVIGLQNSSTLSVAPEAPKQLHPFSYTRSRVYRRFTVSFMVDLSFIFGQY